MTLTDLIGQLKPDKNKKLDIFDREIGVSKHIPLSHFITPHIFETTQGAMGAIIKIQGISFEVTSHRDLNYFQKQWAFALQNLGDEFAVYVTTHRHQATTNLNGDYPDGFAKELSIAYQNKFKQIPLFINDIYLSILLKPGTTQVKKGLHLIERIGATRNEKLYHEFQEARFKKMTNSITHVMSALVDYFPHLLGFIEKKGIEYSEVLSFISILVNGDSRPFQLLYRDIATYLSETRLFFGNKVIHFEGIDSSADKFAAILSIKTYQAKSVPGLLNNLLALPFSYINTHSFLGVDKTKAQELIRLQNARLIQVEDKSTSQIEELGKAADDLASDRLSFGYHHNTLLIFGKSIEDLEDKVARAAKAYGDSGIVVVRETLNLENAFWAQIPGNFKTIRRNALISSNNMSCFSPLHNFYVGYQDQNHLGSAIMLAETRSKTPFSFNLHERASGRKEDIPKGHTTLIGASNAGKTVIMMMINTMLQKYGIRSFIFDRNRGCDIYVRAMGGNYCLLNPNENTGWNPCQLEDTPDNRKFLRDFIKQLVMHPGFVLTASDENQIADVIDRNYSLPRNKRNLSNISSFFRLDFTGLGALSKWLRIPDRTGRVGEYAWVFDNDEDTLHLIDATMGFDMTHLLGTEQDEKKDLLIPISMYLFHRIDRSLDGRLTGVYLDEFQQFLGNRYWEQKIESYQVTWRKENAFQFFATQLPDKVAKSPIASAIIQGAATLLLLPNPKAEEEDYMGSFKLTRKEFEFIKNSSLQDRYFLFKQGHEAAIMKFDLTGMQKYLAVLSGNKLTTTICDELREKLGSDPNSWLPAFYQRVQNL